MKIKKLKIDGDDKIKVELKFDFDEVIITIIESGKHTKYSGIIKIFNDIDHELIGEKIIELYIEYLKGKQIEEKLIQEYETKEYIEIEIPSSLIKEDFDDPPAYS